MACIFSPRHLGLRAPRPSRDGDQSPSSISEDSTATFWDEVGEEALREPVWIAAVRPLVNSFAEDCSNDDEIPLRKPRGKRLEQRPREKRQRESTDACTMLPRPDAPLLKRRHSTQSNASDLFSDEGNLGLSDACTMLPRPRGPLLKRHNSMQSNASDSAASQSNASDSASDVFDAEAQPLLSASLDSWLSDAW